MTSGAAKVLDRAHHRVVLDPVAHGVGPGAAGDDHVGQHVVDRVSRRDLRFEAEVGALRARDAAGSPRARDGEDALDAVDGAEALDGVLQVQIDAGVVVVVAAVVEHGGCCGGHGVVDVSYYVAGTVYLWNLSFGISDDVILFTPSSLKRVSDR